MEITADILPQLVTLDTETGRLYWKERSSDWFPDAADPDNAALRWNVRFAGREAFATKSGPYLAGRIFGRNTTAHRIVWAMSRGKMPDFGIDHINGDTRDNRPCNLRDVPQSENVKNRARFSTNTSGFTGVHKHGKKWIAQMYVDGKPKHIGSYDTIEMAADARRKAADNAGYHANHGR